MAQYGIPFITIDSSRNLASVPFTFKQVQVSGNNMMIQINGTGLSGTFNFEQSIDASTWSSLKSVDSNGVYTTLTFAFDSSTCNSIEMSGLTLNQWIRPVISVAGTGTLTNFKYLFS